MIKLHLDGYITVAVDQHGGRSAPTVTNKFGLVQALAHAIRSGMYAQEAWRGKRAPFVFSLPAELHMVLRYTFCSPDRPISLAEADRRLQVSEEKHAKAALRAAASEGWLAVVSADMHALIVEFGLQDTPMDDGDQEPTIDTRLAVLVNELRRLRNPQNEDTMNSKNHPPLHTSDDSGFTAAVSDDPSIDSRLQEQLLDAATSLLERKDKDSGWLIPWRGLHAMLDGTPGERLRFARARGWSTELSMEEGARLLAGTPK